MVPSGVPAARLAAQSAARLKAFVASARRAAGTPE